MLRTQNIACNPSPLLSKLPLKFCGEREGDIYELIFYGFICSFRDCADHINTDSVW